MAVGKIEKHKDEIKERPSNRKDMVGYWTTYNITQTSWGFSVPVGSVVPIR